MQINLQLILTGLFLIGTAESYATDKTPNIVFILADDCAYTSLGTRGSKNVETPNIDRLAKEGMKFNRAFAATSVCVPFRAELFTGLSPFRNGCAWNHSSTNKDVRTAPLILSEMGYRVGLCGKRHFAPESIFPFETVPGLEPKTSVKQNLYKPEQMEPFMTRDGGQPFVLYVCSIYPHRPWTDGDQSKFDPNKLELPPGVADTPEVRAELVNYFAEVGKLDDLVGVVLDLIKQNGLEEKTVVMFSSEQGWEFPGGKYTCWDQGLHTELIARWPGHIKAGVETNALVQIADVLPTMIQLAGGTPDPKKFDGRSFVDILAGKTETHHDYVYGIHNNIPTPEPYPIRTISDGTYRYIENLIPDKTFVNKGITGTAWFASMEQAGKSGDKHAELIVQRTVNRPKEELYHSSKDPYELENLAANPEYGPIKAKLSKALNDWREKEKDPGVSMDSKEAKNAKR